ncbi:phosphatase PAP2 family protein [Shimia sp. R10_1]|uniref:phosphatase PAP2 family protein n=1 Tax=Shimia sp. R10_1 TaxID=2821095 RepID=UPI001ADA40A3|nr:phosphatase PAP2 family protein [Shimia sp. R10_1]MBO9475730.1 phosphatase PAP2 family protein [Shimia sp. R10_1]
MSSKLQGKAVAYVAAATLVCATLYPSNLQEHYSTSRNGHKIPFVQHTEDVGRHINVALPLAVAIVTRDWRGLGQIGVTAVGTAIATHGQKRLLNDVVIGGTRLGQRPLANGRDHNMPSGHSSTAAAGAWFTMRRYSFWLGMIVIPVLLSTMYARVMLDAHTISATFAGAATGILVAELAVKRTSRFRQLAKRCLTWLAALFSLNKQKRIRAMS